MLVSVIYVLTICAKRTFPPTWILSIDPLNNLCKLKQLYSGLNDMAVENILIRQLR